VKISATPPGSMYRFRPGCFARVKVAPEPLVRLRLRLEYVAGIPVHLRIGWRDLAEIWMEYVAGSPVHLLTAFL